MSPSDLLERFICSHKYPSCLLLSGGFLSFAKFAREVDLLITLIELMSYISHGKHQTQTKGGSSP